MYNLMRGIMKIRKHRITGVGGGEKEEGLRDNNVGF
jgi:hypothetical protein